MNYDNEYLSCILHIISPTGTGTAIESGVLPRIHIRGTIKNRSAYSKVFLLAPNPPMSMTNYSGSGLPYSCASQAFENTPSKQEIPNATFETTILYPNSYYAVGASERIPPSVFFGFVPQSSNTPTYIRFEVPDLLPLRTLTHRSSRKGPEFYANKATIIGVPDSQEALLREIGYVKSQHGVA